MDFPFELVLYPFKVNSVDEIILFRVEDEFEMRFSRDLFAKRVLSSQVDTYKNYIEIEVIGEEAAVVSSSAKIHQFRTPADFIVEIPDQSRRFYESIHTALINEDLNVLMEKAIALDAQVRESGFPECPVPITTTSTHFENFETAIGKPENFPKIPVIQVRHGESIPIAPIERARDLLMKYLTVEQFEIQNSFYKAFFEKVPISKFRSVANSYEECSVEIKRKMSLHTLKRCIGIHAYFVTSGPWRKCWVKLGYNPATDQNNFKYQLVEYRTKRANFQIFQKPEITAEVSKNRDWYLLKECDSIDGFISKALKNFIIYTIDNVGSKEIEKKIEELNDSDFEIFEV